MRPDPKRNTPRGLPRAPTLVGALGVQPLTGGPKLQSLAAASKSVRRLGESERTRLRWKLWQRDSHCAQCMQLLDWPAGCELDHVLPLEDGGTNDEANLQLLCVFWQDGKRAGCHHAKTVAENAARHAGAPLATGDGRPAPPLRYRVW